MNFMSLADKIKEKLAELKEWMEQPALGGFFHIPLRRTMFLLRPWHFSAFLVSLYPFDAAIECILLGESTTPRQRRPLRATWWGLWITSP